MHISNMTTNSDIEKVVNSDEHHKIQNGQVESVKYMTNQNSEGHCAQKNCVQKSIQERKNSKRGVEKTSNAQPVMRDHDDSIDKALLFENQRISKLLKARVKGNRKDKKEMNALYTTTEAFNFRSNTFGTIKLLNSISESELKKCGVSEDQYKYYYFNEKKEAEGKLILGSGSDGHVSVKFAQILLYEGSQPQLCAAKKVNVLKTVDEIQDGVQLSDKPEYLDDIIYEAQLQNMSEIAPKVHAISYMKSKKGVDKAILFMDLAPGVSAESLVLTGQIDKLDENSKLKLLKNILLKVQLLHSKNICHCDYHLGNLFIDTGSLDCLFIDFGSATKLTKKTCSEEEFRRSTLRPDPTKITRVQTEQIQKNTLSGEQSMLYDLLKELFVDHSENKVPSVEKLIDRIKQRAEGEYVIPKLISSSS